jgi:hypothetical protein
LAQASAALIAQILTGSLLHERAQKTNHKAAWTKRLPL